LCGSGSRAEARIELEHFAALKRRCSTLLHAFVIATFLSTYAALKRGNACDRASPWSGRAGRPSPHKHLGSPA
jgi:hypothetical protein